MLATGEAAAYRLRILHGLYGPGSRRVLLEAGLGRGMHVAALDADQQAAAGAGNPRVVVRPADHSPMAASTASTTKGFKKASGL